MFPCMGHVIYHFARTGGIETNPTTFSQRAATFASTIADSGHATLLTRRENRPRARRDGVGPDWMMSRKHQSRGTRPSGRT